MEQQTYANHIRKHPLFHYVLVPVTLLLVAASLVNLVYAFSLTAIVLVITSISLHLVLFIARDYAKKNQDRIILNEMRMRYYLLTGHSFQTMEQYLSISQIAALRFAEDTELLEWLKSEKAFNMEPDAIKQSIQSWKPDHLRV